MWHLKHKIPNRSARLGSSPHTCIIYNHRDSHQKPPTYGRSSHLRVKESLATSSVASMCLTQKFTPRSLMRSRKLSRYFKTANSRTTLEVTYHVPFWGETLTNCGIGSFPRFYWHFRRPVSHAYILVQPGKNKIARGTSRKMNRTSRNDLILRPKASLTWSRNNLADPIRITPSPTEIRRLRIRNRRDRFKVQEEESRRATARQLPLRDGRLAGQEHSRSRDVWRILQEQRNVHRNGVFPQNNINSF